MRTLPEKEEGNRVPGAKAQVGIHIEGAPLPE
jgi:hypothetical protein